MYNALPAGHAMRSPHAPMRIRHWFPGTANHRCGILSGTGPNPKEPPMAIARIVTALAAWDAARATHRSLGKLTNRELADLGLHRGDIEVSALLGR